MILYHFETKKFFRKFLKNFHPYTYLWWPMAPVINIMGIGKNLQNRSDQIFFLSNNFLRFFSGGVPGFFWTLNSVSAFILSKYFSNIFLRPPAKRPTNQPTKKHTTRNPIDHPINGFFSKIFFRYKNDFFAIHMHTGTFFRPFAQWRASSVLRTTFLVLYIFTEEWSTS